MPRPKTFRNYQEQIQFMRSRGIEIPDDREAIEALSTYSYYSLVNLNKHLYGGLDRRDFAGHPSLLDLQLAHMLNMDFYQTVLKGILYVEASFKTKLAYLISEKFGSVSQEDIEEAANNFFYRGHYDPTNELTPGTLRSLRNKYRLLHATAGYNSYSHQFLAGDRQLPPWMFVHDIEFGFAIKWYRILREHDRNEVCARMLWGETGTAPANFPVQQGRDLLDAALELMREYRNVIAHGERIFPSEIMEFLPEAPLFALLPDGMLSREEYGRGIGRQDPFACLLAITRFIHEPVLMLSFLTELQTQLDFARRMRRTMAPGSLGVHEILTIPDFTMDRLIALSHHRFGEISRAYFELINPPSAQGDVQDHHEDEAGDHGKA